ncbi:myelin protein zero-like protein 2 isoform X2 [Perca fluviatilis]|uniref:myelin protein zero-like protein 2 isoform X2 n=1 Tax=Perca fluviatilis TaxID=8168 RepID=UPI001962A0CF|nr:myelin protein zero-like protein 2 isoform X2 [Perca fluviatilis]
MFYPMYRIWPLLLLGGFVVPGVRRVSGIEIYTPKEVEAVNGTDVKLKCTFTSTDPVSTQSVTVSWNFRPINSGADESVFYYQDKSYPPMQGRFKDHAVWSGDIMRRDVSITLLNVPPTFNGTYLCQVRNPPDVHGGNGEIFLRVVNKGQTSSTARLEEMSHFITIKCTTVKEKFEMLEDHFVYFCFSVITITVFNMYFECSSFRCVTQAFPHGDQRSGSSLEQVAVQSVSGSRAL